MKVSGLVDLQVNGYMGVDFSGADLSETKLAWAFQQVLEAGTTAFLVTLVSSARQLYQRNLPMIAEVLASNEFEGRVLGIHLEGPFISKQDGARGAHQAAWVCEPDVRYLEELLDWGRGKVKLLTIAAELAGAEELARCAMAHGVTVSLGHQMAGSEDLERLVQAGAKAVTHLGNGVPAVLPRHDNPIWAALGNDALTAMMITDGHHLPASIIKVIVRTKGAEGCIVVSDASPLAGLEAGQYEAMGHRVILEQSGRLYDPETGYLVGSSASMLACMNHLASLGLLSPEELMAVGFYNPLKLIGVDATQVHSPSGIELCEIEGKLQFVRS